MRFQREKTTKKFQINWFSQKIKYYLWMTRRSIEWASLIVVCLIWRRRRCGCWRIVICIAFHSFFFSSCLWHFFIGLFAKHRNKESACVLQVRIKAHTSFQMQVCCIVGCKSTFGNSTLNVLWQVAVRTIRLVFIADKNRPIAQT